MQLLYPYSVLDLVTCAVLATLLIGIIVAIMSAIAPPSPEPSNNPYAAPAELSSDDTSTFFRPTVLRARPHEAAPEEKEGCCVCCGTPRDDLRRVVLTLPDHISELMICTECHNLLDP